MHQEKCEAMKFNSIASRSGARWFAIMSNATRQIIGALKRQVAAVGNIQRLIPAFTQGIRFIQPIGSEGEM
jgi:hypothetical protein